MQTASYPIQSQFMPMPHYETRIRPDDTIHQPSHHAAANRVHQYNDESPQNNQYYINHHLPVNCMRSDRYPPFHIPSRPSRCPFMHVQHPFQSAFTTKYDPHSKAHQLIRNNHEDATIRRQRHHHTKTQTTITATCQASLENPQHNTASIETTIASIIPSRFPIHVSVVNE